MDRKLNADGTSDQSLKSLQAATRSINTLVVQTMYKKGGLEATTKQDV